MKLRRRLAKRRPQALAAAFAVLLAGAVPAAGGGSAPRIEAGETLLEALHALEAQGLKVIYSSALVGADMRVESPPAPGPLPEMLRALLAPHGLATRKSSGGAWVVVRASPPPGGGDRGARPEGAERTPVHLELGEEIVVTPSHYALLKTEPERRQFLSREEVRKLPHLSDDLYRAVSWLPGTASSDFSADFHVRGGESQEILVMVDGAEIYDPFHIKDINVFSTIDAEAVGGVDFLTGGFPVEYGDRMSGVIDISSLKPESHRRTTLGASFVNARALGAGTFRGDRGTWLASLRRGYLDVVLGFLGVEDQLSPVYYDLLAQVEYRLSGRQTLAANVQGAYDRLDYLDAQLLEGARTRESSAYLWLRLGSLWSSRLYSQTVLATSGIRRDRSGWVREFDIQGEVDDRRSFDLDTLKQEWGRELGERHFLKWGFEALEVRGDADYESFRRVSDPTFTGGGPPFEDTRRVDVEPAGNVYRAYAADRVRLSARATAELGLRWDRQTYTGDGDQVSPRGNFVYALGRQRRSLLRWSWGVFHQSQGIHELQAEDGVARYFPAQRAEHRLIGFEHALPSDRGPGALRGAALRVELYQKVMSDLRPRFENLFGPAALYLIEIGPDRVRVDPRGGEAKGLEILLKQPGSGRFSWWVSYARAAVDDEVDGVAVPRSWDQRHTLTFSVGFDREKWSFNLAGLYHSGWPTTGVTVEAIDGADGSRRFVQVVGPRNGERYPPYHRLDFRASRRVGLRRGELQLFLEVSNVLNRGNVCCQSDHEVRIRDRQGVLVVETERWLPLLPSFGLNWEF